MSGLYQSMVNIIEQKINPVGRCGRATAPHHRDS